MLESIDHGILLSFVTEAQSYTPTIQQGIANFHADPNRLEEVQLAYRQVHTIKGAALIIGMTELGDTAEAVENALEKFQDGNSQLGDEQAATLLRQIEQIQILLDVAASELQTNVSTESDDSMANFANEFGMELPADFAADLPPGFSLDFSADSPMDFSADDEQPETTARPQSPFATDAADEPEDVDPEMLEIFALEAEEHLQTITANLQILEQNPREREALRSARRSSHTLKGAAGVVGFKTTSRHAHRMEYLLDELSEKPSLSNEHTTALLLASTDTLERLAAGATAAELKTELESLFSRFDSVLLSVSASDQAEEEADVIASDVLDETEELDPEMLEVFALEAEEHLQIISANLQILEHNPTEREALQSIRRSSHTLKGAAGVVGFKTTSQLAHRMEDLLDQLAEQPLSSNNQTTALLLASTDALEQLSRGATAAELKKELESLYNRYDNILLSASAIETSASVSALSEFTKQVAAEPEQTASAVNKPAIVENAQSVVAEEDAHKAVAALDDAAELKAEQTGGAGVAAQRTVVRVGLDKLDEMVKLMGEMIISRTILEQRLKVMEAQLNEMELSTGRLRKIAGKLEIDYEASALAGFQNSKSGAQPADFATKVLGVNRHELANAALQQKLLSEVQTSTSNQDFDDLEFDRYTEFHELTRQLVETSTDTISITGELDNLVGDLDALLIRQRRLSEDLQEKMMRLRMVPLGTLSTRLYRTVRVTADGENKQVDLEIEGEHIEIDTQVLNSLVEPLLHLLRNAVVHGIEPSQVRVVNQKPERGLIKLHAYYEGTNIVITISDDGRGMNANKLREKAVNEYFITPEEAAKLNDERTLQLVFLPGFSTAKKINENAGRGVGMDIVRESVQRQQGTISIRSAVGDGTTLTIRLPMSLAVTRALLVRAFGQRFAIPLNVIQSLTQLDATEFDYLAHEKVILGDKLYSIYSLNNLLKLPELAERDNQLIQTLLVQIGENTVALTLDEVVEAREIVIKPLEGLLKGSRGLLGTTILGDGSVVPILDVVSLIQPQINAAIVSAEPTLEPVPQTEIVAPAPPPQKAQLSIMIVDDSPSVRRVMTNLITKTGWEPIVAKDGLEAVELLQTARTLPDVILSDVEMPRMDGYELLATIRRQENLERIPVVMITSRAGDKHRQRALELGASEYVVKPYQDSILLDTIRNLVNN